jgi:hypothetical protein
VEAGAQNEETNDTKTTFPSDIPKPKYQTDEDREE